MERLKTAGILLVLLPAGIMYSTAMLFNLLGDLYTFLIMEYGRRRGDSWAEHRKWQKW